MRYSPVMRLKKTLGSISSQHEKVLQSLRNSTGKDSNYMRLRSTLNTIYQEKKENKNTSMCIPYLGMFMTDLTFIAEGNQDPWNRVEMVFEVVHKIMAFQHNLHAPRDLILRKVNEYKGSLNADLLVYLECMKERCKREEELIEISKRREH